MGINIYGLAITMNRLTLWSGEILIIVLLASYEHCNGTITQQNQTHHMNNKKEFIDWFKEINDPAYDNCSITIEDIQNEGHRKNKEQIISVVRCSTGRGKWNYRSQVQSTILITFQGE